MPLSYVQAQLNANNTPSGTVAARFSPGSNGQFFIPLDQTTGTKDSDGFYTIAPQYQQQYTDRWNQTIDNSQGWQDPGFLAAFGLATGGLSLAAGAGAGAGVGGLTSGAGTGLEATEAGLGAGTGIGGLTSSVGTGLEAADAGAAGGAGTGVGAGAGGSDALQYGMPGYADTAASGLQYGMPGYTDAAAASGAPGSASISGTFNPANAQIGSPFGQLSNALGNLFNPTATAGDMTLSTAGTAAGGNGGIMQSILGPINSALGTNIGPGNLIGTALQSFFANNTANKLAGAAQQVQANSSILNPQQRAQVQQQLTGLYSNPSQFMSTDPYVQALTAQMQKTIPAAVAKSGNPGQVLDQQGSQFATNVAGEYTGLANSMVGALNPGSGGAASAPLLGTSAMVGSQGLTSLGNLFGAQPGAKWPNLFQTSTPTSNGGPFGTSTV